MGAIDGLRASGHPFLVADERGVILEVDAGFERLFGWSREEIVGQPLSRIIPRNLHDAHHLGFSRFLSTGEPTLLDKPLRLRALAKDGREFDAEHFIVAERVEGRWRFAATLRPA